MGGRSHWNANLYHLYRMTYENLEVTLEIDGQDVIVRGNVIEDHGDYWTPPITEATVEEAWIEDDPVDLDFDQIQRAERLLLEEVGIYL